MAVVEAVFTVVAAVAAFTAAPAFMAEDLAEAASGVEVAPTAAAVFTEVDIPAVDSGEEVVSMEVAVSVVMQVFMLVHPIVVHLVQGQAWLIVAV